MKTTFLTQDQDTRQQFLKMNSMTRLVLKGFLFDIIFATKVFHFCIQKCSIFLFLQVLSTKTKQSYKQTDPDEIQKKHINYTNKTFELQKKPNFPILTLTFLKQWFSSNKSLPFNLHQDHLPDAQPDKLIYRKHLVNVYSYTIYYFPLLNFLNKS